MNKRKYYIAHRTTIRHQIRDVVCPQLRERGITPINPFYKADGTPRKNRKDIGLIDKGEREPYYIGDLEHCKNIVIRDLSLIIQSDGVICILEKASIGAAMEMFYASFTLRKPVYIATSRYSNHPWLKYLVDLSGGFIVESFEELLNRIEELK